MKTIWLPVIGLAATAMVATVVVNQQVNTKVDQTAASLGFQKQGGSAWNPVTKIPTYFNPATGQTLSYADMRAKLPATPALFTSTVGTYKQIAMAGELGFRVSQTDEFGHAIEYTHVKTGERLDAFEMNDRIKLGSAPAIAAR